jgi:membrane protease YdiL (CAAX protease family)
MPTASPYHILSLLLAVSGISFWGSMVFSRHTRPRLAEGWAWLDWRPLPHDSGKVLGMGFLASLFLQMVVFTSLSRVVLPGALHMAITLITYQGLLVVVLYRHLRRTRIPESLALGFEPGNGLHDMAWGFVGYCMAMPLVYVSALLSESLFWAFNQQITLQESVTMVSEEYSVINSVLLFLMIGFVGPFLEEIIFRGVVFAILVKKFGAMGGLILQALLFALVHLHAPSVLPLFALAILLGLVYVYTRRMMACVWMHVCFNSMTLIVNLPLFQMEGGG